jgi:hypothetical protein
VRKLLITLIAAAGLAVAASLPAHAAAFNQPGGNPQYVCDGNGAGSCMSLIPGDQGGFYFNGAPLFAYGEANGAWRWDVFAVGTVTSGSLTGDTVYVFGLYADNDLLCAHNSGGSADISTCVAPFQWDAAQEWVYDTHSGNDYLVNVGRTNDKGIEEVLCNPGGGGQLTIVPISSCTAYHETWAFS